MQYFPFDSYQFTREPYSLKLKIADFVVQLNSTDEALMEALGKLYFKFTTEETGCFLKIDMHLTERISFYDASNKNELFVDQDYIDNIFHVHTNYCRAYMTPDNAFAKVIVNPQPCSLWYNHIIPILFGTSLVRKESVLFHGAGIVADGKGHIFFGPSGIGKTTVTHFSVPRAVLGDDLILLQKTNGSFDIFATPFNKEKNGLEITNRKAPIKACYRLTQDNQTFMNEMNPSNTVAELFSSVRVLNKINNNNQKILDFCTKIAERITCYELHFKKDNTFWRIIDELS